jgi:ribosomal protein S18 acetylase RimI-like enzyme
MPHPMKITIEPSTPDHPEAVGLIDALSNYLQRHFGSDGRASFSSWSEHADRSVFALARVGCGAIRPLEENIAEVKRMYASPNHPGVGSAILRFLEEEAQRLGYHTLRLETRWKNARAVRFYEKNGYRICENYGAYVGRVESACFEKPLAS